MTVEEEEEEVARGSGTRLDPIYFAAVEVEEVARGSGTQSNPIYFVPLDVGAVQSNQIHVGSIDRKQCAICYEEMEPERHIVVNPSSCAHEFHQTCFETWQRTRATCPLCRQQVRFVLYVV